MCVCERERERCSFFSPIDILDGNSKGIMRVILGIAERYQPRSVKQRTENSKPTTPTGKKEPDVPRDHMTFLLQTDRNSMLKRSVSPDGMSRGGLSSFPSNSCSVPNMASLNVHAGGGAGDRMSTPRSGGGHRYEFFAPEISMPALSTFSSFFIGTLLQLTLIL